MSAKVGYGLFNWNLFSETLQLLKNKQKEIETMKFNSSGESGYYHSLLIDYSASIEVLEHLQNKMENSKMEPIDFLRQLNLINTK